MTTTHAETAGLEAPWPPEWWERWADRRAAWVARHATWLRRLSVARLVLLAVSVTWLVMASLVIDDVRQGMVAVYAGSVWVCVLWFLILRTKTVTLSGTLRWFAASVLWSLIIGWALHRFSHTPDMFPSFTGPTTMIASLGEESLKLLPLAILAVAAPARVRRFSVADWMLLGVVSGAGFECAEEVLKRIVARDQWGDALFIASNLATFGPGGSTQPDRDVFFPGHHVTTGLVACAVGIAVALWRSSRRSELVRNVTGRVVAVLVVATTWWSAVSVHAHINLQGEDVDLLPWPVRTWLAVLPDAWGTTWMLVIVVAVVLAVDGHRHRAGGGWVFPLPVAGPFLRVDDALARLAAPSSAPGAPRRAVDALFDVLISAVRAWWFVLADTIRSVTTFVAAGARRPGERWWHAARTAQASVVVLRRSRELVLGETAPAARPVVARSVAFAALVALLVAAFPIARWLARVVETRRDRSLGITWWLAGLLDRLGDWWGDLSGWEKVLVIGAAFALTAAITLAAVPLTTGGMLMAGASGATALHSVAANSDSLADVVRDPAGAAENYWKTATPASVLLDAGTLALTFWAPAKIGTAVRPLVRDAIGNPRGFAAAYRAWSHDNPRNELGHISLGFPDGIARVNGRRPINYLWADRTYGGPDWRANGARNWSDELQTKYPDGVPFTSQGFPDFSRYQKGQITSTKLTGDYATDARIANAAYRSEAFPNGLPGVPDGMVWHHVEDAKTMQLVPSDVHRAVRHTGGVAVMKMPR